MNNSKFHHTFYIRIFDCITQFQDNKKEYEPPHRYIERSSTKIWAKHVNLFGLQGKYTWSNQTPFQNFQEEEKITNRNSLVTF